MDQFERQFEHLDVQTQTMDEAMQGVTTLNIPEVGEGASGVCVCVCVCVRACVSWYSYSLAGTSAKSNAGDS